jgi:hypothetical protein
MRSPERREGFDDTVAIGRDLARAYNRELSFNTSFLQEAACESKDRVDPSIVRMVKSREQPGYRSETAKFPGCAKRLLALTDVLGAEIEIEREIRGILAVPVQGCSYSRRRGWRR